MGNHGAGRAMGRTAEAILKREKTLSKERALEILDDICKPYRGCDAEFEADGEDYVDYTYPNGPLGKLVAIAFSNRKWQDWFKDFYAEDGKASDAWSLGPLEQFRKRYDIY